MNTSESLAQGGERHWGGTRTSCLLVSSIDNLYNFANSLDPDQARQNVGPDLDLNCLIL